MNTKENMEPTNQKETEMVNVKRSVETVEETDDETSPSKRAKTTEEILDLASTFGLKVGDRIEVQWDIGDESEERTHWWGATLLEHDGRTEDSVAVRVLSYDPYPEGGFPEKSEESVIFIGQDTLLDVDTQDKLTFRLPGDENATVWFGKDSIETIVNEVLSKAFNKNSATFRSLPSAQQALIAEQIATKKEKLIERLSNKKGIVTSEGMKSILAEIMREE